MLGNTPLSESIQDYSILTPPHPRAVYNVLPTCQKTPPEQTRDNLPLGHLTPACVEHRTPAAHRRACKEASFPSNITWPPGAARITPSTCQWLLGVRGGDDSYGGKKHFPRFRWLFCVPGSVLGTGGPQENRKPRRDSAPRPVGNVPPRYVSEKQRLCSGLPVAAKEQRAGLGPVNCLIQRTTGQGPPSPTCIWCK